jgi:tetratricopeptide (TPR) repeat protein
MESKPFRQGVPSLLVKTPKVRTISFGSVLIFCWLPFRMAAQGLESTPSPAAGDVAKPSASPAPSLASPQPSATATPGTSQSKAFAEAFRHGWDAAGDGRYNDAIIEYTQAIQLKPDDAVVYNDRGIAYLALRQYSQAIEDFTEAIRLKPDLAGAYNDRGNAYGLCTSINKRLQTIRRRCVLNPASFRRTTTGH